MLNANVSAANSIQRGTVSGVQLLTCNANLMIKMELLLNCADLAGGKTKPVAFVIETDIPTARRLLFQAGHNGRGLVGRNDFVQSSVQPQHGRLDPVQLVNRGALTVTRFCFW